MKHCFARQTEQLLYSNLALPLVCVQLQSYQTLIPPNNTNIFGKGNVSHSGLYLSDAMKLFF